MTRLPISVVVATKNEAARIGRCLAALSAFAEIVVADSESTDATQKIAEQAGATVIPFRWDGRYPKKRQWCLNTLTLRHDWVFFVDADEIVTPALVAELGRLFSARPSCAGYFVRGRYVVDGTMLRHGFINNKLCLIDRTLLAFPVVDDLGLPGMGEMEGHYQPSLKPGIRASIGQIDAPLLHETTSAGWLKRHQRYAAWEAGMNARNAWPDDPVAKRRWMKTAFRAMPCRPLAAFMHSYILNMGVLDGAAGWRMARDRYRYYRMIEAL